MQIIYVLIPLSVLLMALAIGAFFWAVRNDQFEDLDTPALDILDDDDPCEQEETGGSQPTHTDPNPEGSKDRKSSDQ